MRTYRDRIYERYASGFQDRGPTFDAVAARRWGRAYDWYFRNWLPADKGAHLADLACGSGSLLHFFRERGYSNVAGVDISPEQAALSRQVTEAVAEDDVLHFLKTRENTYDLITALDLVEHFRKEEVLTFLDGCYAALRPGGRLILQTPNAGIPWGVQPRHGDFTHETGFSPNALGRLLRMVGFGCIQARECDPPPYGSSLLSSIRFAFWQFIRMHGMVRNLIETGSAGDRVFTRVFLMSGVKR